MLCCVPKNLADGDPFHDEAPFRDEAPFHNEALFLDETSNKTPLSICETWIKLYSEEDAPPPILLPCAICGRTFMPQSLEKHTRICQRTATKKRKPFDSAKQRIQGTELAEFLPKQEPWRHQDEKTTISSWKKTHDDFLRTIREARGEVMTSSNKQCNSLISSGPPTRANEKGTCPTCNRQFGIKAYDRHVAWCKDRITRMPVSPATNLAKERLEARMRYKAPVFKNRRAINREKYSPGSAVNQGVKTSVSSPTLVKSKESISMTNGSRQSPVKQKPPVVKRPGQLKESPISSGPMKSRLIDRTNNWSFLLLRPAEDHDILTSTSCRSSHFAISSRRPLHFPPVKSRINSDSVCNEITSPATSFRKQSDRNETISQRIPNDEMRTQEICSAKTQKNIVSARSQGHPTINDIAVNDNTLGVIVQPYRIHTDMQKDIQLVTWKQISRKTNNLQCNDSVNYNFSQEFQLLDLDLQCNQENEINTIEKEDKIEKELLITKNDFTQINDELKDSEIDKLNSNKLTWLNGIQNLNQTYLIKDSEDIYNESSEILHSKWKPIKHSPRVEFYFKDRENENEINKTKLNRKIIESDEEIRATKQELKTNIESKEDIKAKVIEHKVKKLGTDSKDEKDNWKVNEKEIEVIERKIEKLNIDARDKDNQNLINEENAGHDVKKLEVNVKGKRESQRMDDTDITEFDKLSMHKEDEKDKQIAIDNGIIENIKCTIIKENEQNLSDFDEHIQLLQDTSKEYFTKLKSSSTDSNNDLTLDFLQNFFETPSSECKDPTLYIDNSLTVSDNINYIQDDLNLKDEMLQYECDTCCNLLKLQENAAAFVCNQSDINNMMSLNNCSNLSDPEDETLSCQNNVISCNSLDLIENIKVISSSVSSRAISTEKESTKNIKNVKETEINEEISENNLIILYNKDCEGNLKGLNSEILLSQNSEINLANKSDTNNIPLQVNRQRQEQVFDSDNFENIEDCLKNGKTDSNTDIDKRSNDISSCSIIKTEVATSEGLRKRNMDNVDNEEFNYGSDDIVFVGEHNTRGANDLVSSVTLKDNAETQYRRDETFLKVSVNLSKGISDSTKRAAKERPVNSVEIKHKIRENMNRLRGSTDSLISSVEFIDLAKIKRPKENYAYEQESIEIIRPRQSRVFRGLPDIRNDSAELREDSERSYWERASKISRNRLIDVDSIRTGYVKSCGKFVKRNPRVRILPPVPNPLIERRKIELATRPAWCNYVRGRPDFNLVLKARTGTCKDYDPFLLAEQQMNDLLSDMSDQSMTGSPKLQQTHNLYPLSHSSAFVKYPISHMRASLIEPPIEFDDVASDFSSDSTETNSISREIFLSKPVFTSKNITDVTGLKPIKELGRRVIIDKSKALGVDERRGVIASADRPRKIFDKITPVTKSLIDQSNSIRASSAPRTNSHFDRKISNDVKKVRESTITDNQSLSRSSDQSLNQSNNNYSSLSGSNLSLSSIISSSELDVKRSNSMFDELMTCFKEDEINLKSFLNNDSFDLSSSGGDRQRNGSLISDGELSSPDSYKPRDHSKLSNDSAYSSLNRKYSHHGRSTNDVIGRLDEDVPRNEMSPTQPTIKCKLSKFCHECGQRFPETAKFCCECGVRRLAL
ncbi:uncharacterized protein [Anoplolepis gracilipes]|uniref:uncharacterized protein n=1 Tax=Anoplolepis gracilipes TaxID=354296 RepID=UPI003B9F8801